MISTHTPLAGRDFNALNVFVRLLFLLTRPSRGATRAEKLEAMTPEERREWQDEQNRRARENYAERKARRNSAT